MEITDRKNPCEMSCMICFDMTTKRLEKGIYEKERAKHR